MIITFFKKDGGFEWATIKNGLSSSNVSTSMEPEKFSYYRRSYFPLRIKTKSNNVKLCYMADIPIPFSTCKIKQTKYDMGIIMRQTPLSTSFINTVIFGSGRRFNVID